MQPAIQYVRSADGAGIACWAMGEGMPLVILPNTPFSHVQLEWEIPECREWYQRLMQGRRLVRYDARGIGLSSRDVADFSMEAQLRDLEAVLDRCTDGPVALYASGDMGMVAVRFAALHPERVSHLVLWCSWSRRADISQTPQTRTLRALMDQDWEIYTETVARVLAGWENEALARRFAAFFREAASPETLRLSVPEVYGWDVTPDLARVEAPVLVLQRRDMPAVPVSVARSLACALPTCNLALLDGSSPFPWVDDTAVALRTVSEFLGGSVGGSQVASVAHGSSVTILFTDIESSTELTGFLGDERAQELVRAHNQIVREALTRHSGSEIKHTGDGIMASFNSATGGLECAIEIQRQLEARNETAETGFRVRIGLNAGEPVSEESDLFGTSVQLAARISAHADAGQVLVSNVVRELVAGKGFLFSEQGDVPLRGFDEPVRLFEVRWQE